MKRRLSGHTTARTLVLAALLGVTVAGTTGCGYSTQSPYPKRFTTVAVPLWRRGKDVYWRDLEIRLTEAIKKAVVLSTPYTLADPGHADTLLTGSIESVQRAVLSRNPDTGEPQEEHIALVLAFEWKDLKTGKVLRKEKAFHAAGTRVTSRSAGTDLFQGSEATIDKAARLVVETMQSEWGEK